MPQLDGVRAVAIGMVLVGHELLVPQVQAIAHWPRMGVTLFFVLSGFLITGILLRYRDAGGPRGTQFKIFYIRRSLRIFPVYYLTILVLCLLRYPPVGDDLAWHLTYTSNLAAAYFQQAHDPVTAHLWSLCVEEQFYLVWPWVVLLARPAWMHRLALGLVAAGLGYKLFGALAELPWVALSRSPFGCLDSLGLGAVLAVHRHDPRTHATVARRFRALALLVGPLLLASLMAYRSNVGVVQAKNALAYVTLVDLGVGLTAVPVLLSAAEGRTGSLGALLGWSPLRYIGRISYGIYLFHPLVHALLFSAVYPRVGAPTRLAHFALTSLLSVGLAAVSWTVFEGPIHRLKQRFTLQPPAEPAGSESAN